jgi:hypothetical protein
MSGFLPDLASWALRGGAGNSTGDNNNDNDEGQTPGSQLDADGLPVLTPEQVRAQRLARIQQLQASTVSTSNNNNQPEPMQIDSPVKADGTSTVSSTTASETASASTSMQSTSAPAPETTDSSTPTQKTDQKKQKMTSDAKESSSTMDTTQKLQRKKELLLQKVLGIALNPNTSSKDNSCVLLDALEGTEVSAQNMAEVLATRLSLALDDPVLQTTPLQKPLIAYLAQSHRKASEELKSMQQMTRKTSGHDDMMDLLQEIQKQVVSRICSNKGPMQHRN